MFDLILRKIYLRNKKRFHDFFMEDLLLDIPKNISEPAITIIQEKRTVITQWLFWQAHTISRRDITDFLTMERKLGILTQIKLMITILGNSSSPVLEDHPTMGPLEEIPKDYTKDIESFKKGQIREVKTDENIERETPK